MARRSHTVCVKEAFFKLYGIQAFELFDPLYGAKPETMVCTGWAISNPRPIS
jgi:hypothetical protein